MGPESGPTLSSHRFTAANLLPTCKKHVPCKNREKHCLNSKLWLNFKEKKKKKIHAMEYLTSLLILYDSIFLHTSFMIIDSTLYSSIFFPRSADLPLRNTSWISLHKSILCKSKQTLPSLPAFKCTTFTYRRALKNSFKS